MNKKLEVTIKIIDNVVCKYTDSKIYMEQNLKALKIEEVIYFVWYLLLFESFEQMDVLSFHALAALLWKVDKRDI